MTIVAPLEDLANICTMQVPIVETIPTFKQSIEKEVLNVEEPIQTRLQEQKAEVHRFQVNFAHLTYDEQARTNNKILDMGGKDFREVYAWKADKLAIINEFVGEMLSKRRQRLTEVPAKKGLGEEYEHELRNYKYLFKKLTPEDAKEITEEEDAMKTNFGTEDLKENIYRLKTLNEDMNDMIKKKRICDQKEEADKKFMSEARKRKREEEEMQEQKKQAERRYELVEQRRRILEADREEGNKKRKREEEEKEEEYEREKRIYDSLFKKLVFEDAETIPVKKTGTWDLGNLKMLNDNMALMIQRRREEEKKGEAILIPASVSTILPHSKPTRGIKMPPMLPLASSYYKIIVSRRKEDYWEFERILEDTYTEAECMKTMKNMQSVIDVNVGISYVIIPKEEDIVQRYILTKQAGVFFQAKCKQLEQELAELKGNASKKQRIE